MNRTAKFAKVVAATGVVVVAAGALLGFTLSAALAQGETTRGPSPAGGSVPRSAEERLHLQRIEEIKAESAKAYAVAIAVVISLSCLAAGYAVGKVGSAAMGAASEKPELMGRALLFVALAEGIAIYGVLAAILLYTKIGT